MNRAATCTILFQVGIALLAPLSASAEDPAPSDADLALAKQYYNLGKTYYDQAAYEKALTSFQESYRLSHRPALLYNIGRCQEALGDLEQAIQMYEQYLKRTGRQDATIQARIRNLRARVEAKKRTAKKTPATKPPGPARKVEPHAPLKAPTPQPPAQRDTSTSWMTWTGWTMVGLGAAAIGAAVFLGIKASAKASLVEDAFKCPVTKGLDGCINQSTGKKEAYSWSQIEPFEQQAHQFQLGFIISLAAGLAVAAGGVTMILLAPSGNPSTAPTTSASLAPVVGPKTLGLAGSFTF